MSANLLEGVGRPLGHNWIQMWSAFNLTKQFAITSTIVLIAGMMVIGYWVAAKIQNDVTQNTSFATALYMDSFIAPLLQDLAVQDQLTAENQQALDALMNDTAIGSRIASYKIWKPDGLIVAAARKAIVGQKFPVTNNLKQAWSGTISAEFDTLEDIEDQAERADGIAYLETYSPIREPRTGRVIAVAEFYERADVLERDLLHAKLQSWLIVGVVTLLMVGMMSIIVQRGSRTIERQESALKHRILELSDLRNRLKGASRRSTELNEVFLRRVGSDLHDGPAQLIGLALLRLDSVRSLVKSAHGLPVVGEDDLEIVQKSLDDALAEIRNLSAGLVLPELNELTLAEIIRKAVTTHESRSLTEVTLTLGELPAAIGKSMQICLYRLLQEGLNNAERHAQGAAKSVIADCTDNVITVEVTDAGTGFDPAEITLSGIGLGLPGLRERIESIGGSFEVRSGFGEGTRLIAKFPLIDPELGDGH